MKTVVPDGRRTWFALAKRQQLKVPLGFATVMQAEY